MPLYKWDYRGDAALGNKSFILGLTTWDNSSDTVGARMVVEGARSIKGKGILLSADWDTQGQYILGSSNESGEVLAFWNLSLDYHPTK